MIRGKRVSLRPSRQDDLPRLRRWHDEHLYGILAAEFNARYRPARTNWVVGGEPFPQE